jgi:hypothetical protein
MAYEQDDHDKSTAAANLGKDRPRFTIFVNNKPFETNEHMLTGSEIKTLGGVPADYELYEVKGSNTVPVGNEETVHIHNNQHFRAIPAGTFGACQYRHV